MQSFDHSSRDPLMGTRIDGRYTVHGLLGRGAQAVVYEGTHDELARPVAIKVLDVSWAGESNAITRFLREARTASSLSHSHIVDVSDLGRLSDGRPYLVMPKVPGTALSALLAAEGPQPATRVARLLAGVGSALDFIHARGFVHRDVKPENLMFVQKDDGIETVVLLDFGIAVLTSANAPRLTQKNALFGTPEYMPPEVWEGRLPDGSGDVYALATVAFELLTGKLPFDDDNPLQLLAHKYRTPAPRLCELRHAQFSAALEAVIARGLTRDPHARFASAGEFIEQLQLAADGGEIELPAQTSTTGNIQRSDPRTAHGRYALALRPGRRMPLRAALGRAHARLSTQILRRTLRRRARDGARKASSVSVRESPRVHVRLALAVGLGLVVLMPSRIDTTASVSGPAKTPAAHAAALPTPEVTKPSSTTATARTVTQPSASPPAPPASVKLSPVATKANAPTSANSTASTKPPAPGRNVSEQQHMASGTAALLRGHPERAIEFFLAVTAAVPDHAQAWRGLGLSYERTHEDARALAAYRRYLNLATDTTQREAVRKRMRALGPQ